MQLAPFFVDWIPEGSFEKKTAWKLFIASLQGFGELQKRERSVNKQKKRKRKRKKKKFIAK
jgi:hypothetical protein